MALQISVNKYNILFDKGVPAGTVIASLSATGGTEPYTFSLDGEDLSWYSLNGTDGTLVTVTKNMLLSDMWLVKAVVTDSTGATDTSDWFGPDISAPQQDYFDKTNTIFKITQDLDLKRGALLMLEGCTLDFQGGSIKNGKIFGNNTVIKAGSRKIFDSTTLELAGTWNVSHLKPEWFGAKSYKKDVLNNPTGSISTTETLVNSNSAFDSVKAALISTNVHSILLSGLYYITKEIDINVTAHYTSGVTIEGSGTDTGFIANMVDTSSAVLSINRNSNIISQYDFLSNFAVYITNNSQLDSAILLYEIIRSTCSDVKVYGGFAKFEKGIYHLHSVVNNNIFLNVFERCVGVNSTKGGGLHYSQETYQPTLQNISNCVFQQLAGAAIESEPTTITGGGFGGVIIGNELEGNTKGAIALSGISGLSVINNYFECADYSAITNYFDNVPPAIFTFGIISGSTGSEYITNIFSLNFSNNQIGGAAGSIDYAVIICSTQSGGRTRSVNISNNIINSSTASNVGCKYITKIQNCQDVNINNNIFNVNYSDVDENFPVDIVDISVSGVNYLYQNISNSFSTTYKYGYSKGPAILRTNAFATVSNYPYLVPKETTANAVLSDGDFIFLETNNTIYKVLKGGKLHYNTGATFTEGSNAVVCSGSVWNWSIGDVVNSEYINNGKANITAISGSNFTLSENAISTIEDWLTDAIVLPYELSSEINTSGMPLERPEYKYTKIPLGYKFFDASLQIPIFWNGSKWINSNGQSAFNNKGTTSLRPVNLSADDSGFQYYDTTLKKYICWDGTLWTNLDGTALT